MNVVACPTCSQKLNYNPQQAGKQVRCPACQTEMMLPAAPNSGSTNPSAGVPSQTPLPRSAMYGTQPQSVFTQGQAPSSKAPSSNSKKRILLWSSVGGILVIVMIVLVAVFAGGRGSDNTTKNNSPSKSDGPAELFQKYRDSMLNENYIVAHYDLSIKEIRQKWEKTADDMARSYVEFSELNDLEGRAKVKKYFGLMEQSAKTVFHTLRPEQIENLRNAKVQRVDILDNGQTANVVLYINDLPYYTVYVKEDGYWRIKYEGLLWQRPNGTPNLVVKKELTPTDWQFEQMGIDKIDDPHAKVNPDQDIFPIPKYFVAVKPTMAENGLKQIHSAKGVKKLFAYECDKTIKEVGNWYRYNFRRRGLQVYPPSFKLGNEYGEETQSFEVIEQELGQRLFLGFVLTPVQDGMLRVVVVTTVYSKK